MIGQHDEMGCKVIVSQIARLTILGLFLLSIDAMGWVGLSVLLSITSDTLSFQMNFAVFAISMTLLLLPSF